MIQFNSTMRVASTLQLISAQPTNTKTPLEKLLVHIEVHSTRQMLTSNERFDDTSDPTLLVDVNQGFKIHRVRKGRQCGEHLGIRRGIKVGALWVDPDSFFRCCRVNQIWESTVALQLREIYAYATHTILRQKQLQKQRMGTHQ